MQAQDAKSNWPTVATRPVAASAGLPRGRWLSTLTDYDYRVTSYCVTPLLLFMSLQNAVFDSSD